MYATVKRRGRHDRGAVVGGRTLKSRVHVLVVSVGVAIVFLLVVYASLVAFTTRTHFPDSRLEAAVRDTLEEAGRAFSPAELERITELNVEGRGITSLDGIEQLANLAVLNLRGNRVADLTPLATLSRLQHVSLRDNNITSLEAVRLDALSALAELRSLDLRDNRGPSHPERPGDRDRLSDIAVLSGFEQLEVLDLADNHIADISALSGLTRLRRLDLRNNPLALEDVTALETLTQLEYLNLRATGITDLEGIQDLQHLGYLNLHSNSGITSIVPVAELSQLHTLILRGVPIGPEIDRIGALGALRRLNIRDSGVSDLTPLARLMEEGALQDDPEQGVYAEIDIRENPVHLRGDHDGYQVLEPHWRNVSRREPAVLPPPLSREIVISEVVSNAAAGPGEGGNEDATVSSDWIELYNRRESPVDLSGYYLSDHADRSTRWSFPEGARIDGHSRMIVWASGHDQEEADTVGPDGHFRTSFRLSAAGEAVLLTAPDGITRVDAVWIPPLPPGVSYGLQDTDGEAFVMYSEPTPGEANSGALRHRRLAFSHEQGLYTDGFDLEITVQAGFDDRDISLYYSLDGSIPDPAAVRDPSSYEVMNYEADELESWYERTYRYEAPVSVRADAEAGYTIADSLVDVPRIIDIDTTSPDAEFWEWQPPRSDTVRATTVRAAAFAREPSTGEYRRVSRVESATYIVTPLGSDRFSLPVVSIITPPSGLFDYDDGVYVAGRIDSESVSDDRTWMAREANYSQSRELPVHLSYFERPQGDPVLSIDAGVRIHGSFSRSHPLKSLRLYARREYDVNNYFEHSFFPNATRRDRPGSQVERYKRLLLRSGQSLFRSHMQDAVIHSHLTDHVYVDLLRYRPVVHFVNGEYWGIKNLRERFDRFYLESVYGLDPDEVIVVENPYGTGQRLVEGRPGEHLPFVELVRFIENADMDDSEHYRRVERSIDVLSFIDYNITRIYAADRDGVNKHVAVWRRRGEYEADAPYGHDGRWRWHTWDLDNAFMDQNNTMEFYANDGAEDEAQQSEQDGSRVASDTEERPQHRDESLTSMLVNLLRNDEFRALFLNRFAGLLNTVFQPDEMVSSFDRAEAALEPEIAEHVDRWGYPFSVDAWRDEVQLHRDFATERLAVQRQHILEYFQRRGYDLPGTYELETGSRQPSGGYVRVSQVDVDRATPGVSGRSSWRGIWFTGVPLVLEAVPEPGYRFSAWHGDTEAAAGADAATERRIALEATGNAALFASFEPVRE